MTHLLANLVSLPLPRALRRRVRRTLVQFRVRDWLAYRRFERSLVRDNAVLLVEANDCHGEVIGGFLDYFRDLGYAVDVLVNDAIRKEDPFCRLDKAGVEIWSCYFYAFRWFFSGSRIRHYRHVVLMSSAGYRFIDGSDAASIVQAYPALQRLSSLYVVEHELRDVQRFGEAEMLAAGRIITLGRFGKGLYACPLCFGPVSAHEKRERTTFVTVGSVRAFRKNHAALLAAVSQLQSEGLDFQVVVVGLGSEEAIPESARHHIVVTGRLDYPKMFAQVEAADYFLPLLDHTNPDHERYVTTGVTGSAQLIYGFSKVPIIEPHFAAFYGFDMTNAIVTNDLTDGMRQAIVATSTDYRARRVALDDLAARRKAASLANLRRELRPEGSAHD